MLPISKKHFDFYLKQQKQQNQTVVIKSDGKDKHTTESLSAPRKLDVTGNWRVTQAIDKHNVTYMRSGLPKDDEARHKKSLIAVSVVFAIFALVCIILLLVIRNY